MNRIAAEVPDAVLGVDALQLDEPENDLRHCGQEAVGAHAGI